MPLAEVRRRRFPRRLAWASVAAVATAGVAAVFLVLAFDSGRFSVTLQQPRVGTYAWTSESTAFGAARFTETVSRTAGGWLLTFTRRTLIEQLTVAWRDDGLYVTADSVGGPGGFAQRCTVREPLLTIPNPLTSGRSWSSTLTCPSGDVAGDPATLTTTSRVTGRTTVVVAGQKVPVIIVGTDSTEKFGSVVVQRTHGTAAIDAILGISIEQTSDTSGRLTEHRQETAVSLP